MLYPYSISIFVAKGHLLVGRPFSEKAPFALLPEPGSISGVPSWMAVMADA